MSTLVHLQRFPAAGLERLRNLALLLAAWRQIREPLTDPAGLRQTIEVLLNFAAALGLDPRWIERLQAALDNEALFRVLLAVVRYVVDLSGGLDNAAHLRLLDEQLAAETQIDAQALVDWLPLVIQLVELVTRLRGGR